MQSRISRRRRYRPARPGPLGNRARKGPSRPLWDPYLERTLRTGVYPDPVDCLVLDEAMPWMKGKRY